MKNLLIGTLLALSLSLVGCLGGGGGGSSSGSGYYISSSTVNSFVDLLEYEYGTSFTLVKGPYEAESEGFVVVYDHWTGDYMAYDIYDYRPGQSFSYYQAISEYQETYIHDIYVDAYGETMFVGDTYYNDGGYAGEFVFEEIEATGKDLEKIGAFQEAVNVSKISDALASEYGFSDDRAESVAKMAVAWKKLSGSRAMTESDTAKFTKELVGKELADANAIIKKVAEGDTASYDEFIQDAAEFNGTNPEQIKDFLSNHILGQTN